MASLQDNAFFVYVGEPGMQVSFNGGVLYISGSLVTVASGTIAVTKNTTNYIYLLFSNNTVTANTSGFPAACFPMATVVTDNDRPKTITDSRADYVTPSSDQGVFVADSFKSSTANPASAGVLRLAKTDAIKWRDNANSADLALSLDSSDILNFGMNILRSVTISDATLGVSPSNKVIYSNVTIAAAVTGGTQYHKAIQGLMTLATGSNPAEVWGLYGIVQASGTAAATGVWPCVGELSLSGTGTFGANQINSFVSAGYFHSFVQSTITLANASLVEAPLVGDIDMATGRRKASCAVAASLNGAINQSTAGAGAGFKVYQFNNQCSFDYGVDLSLTGMSTTTFAAANIRFSTDQTFSCLTTAITANVTTTAAPAGSLAITTHATGVGSIFRSDGSKWQFLINA